MLAALSSVMVLSALPVQVESQACPSGPQVEQALVAMLPSVPDTARHDVAHVTRIDRGLRIELVNADAAVVAERSLDVEGSCVELAAVAAVVIATWESDVHPEFTRPRADPIPTAEAKAPAASPAAPTPRSLAYYDVALGPPSRGQARLPPVARCLEPGLRAERAWACASLPSANPRAPLPSARGRRIGGGGWAAWRQTGCLVAVAQRWICTPVLG